MIGECGLHLLYLRGIVDRATEIFGECGLHLKYLRKIVNRTT